MDDSPASEQRRFPPHRSAAEKLLEESLLAIGLRPIHSYQLSKMTMDFAFPHRNIAIEVDGPHHLYHKQFEKDKRRDAAAHSFGWVILRFTDREVRKNPQGIAQMIKNIVGAMPAPKKPLPEKDPPFFERDY